MKRMFLALALLAIGACTTTGLDSTSKTIESCYDTGFSLHCIVTPGGPDLTLKDVNADGITDTFVCADELSSESDSVSSDSTSDSDAEAQTLGDDEDSESGESGESTSDSDSDSSEECGADSDSDGDDDGVDDMIDCDCTGEDPPTDPPPGEDPPTDPPPGEVP